MEKQCVQCGNNYNAKRQKQKYCSVECQHQSYRKDKVERIEKKCFKCGKIFYKIPSKSNNNNGKYCNRKCKDEHQKEIYLNVNNPVWGRKSNENEKEKRSKLLKKLWKNDEFRNSVKNGQKKFLLKNGYWPGSDKNSVEKRKKTMLNNYGVEHNWNGKYGERDCDKTTLEIYGKTSVDMLIEYTHDFGKQTNIELILENVLNELNIPNQPKFRIYNKNKKEFYYREYDFLIIGTNILIETDGDYWHGNTNKFPNLSEFQKQIILNDKRKQSFAESHGYSVIRFWEEDIVKNINNIKNKLIILWEKKSN